MNTATIEQLWRDYTQKDTDNHLAGVISKSAFEAAIIELLDRIRRGELQP